MPDQHQTIRTAAGQELVCRVAAGGCGRPIVIVETTSEFRAFGALKTRLRKRFVAVHRGEEGGLKPARMSYRLAVLRRTELEGKCYWSRHEADTEPGRRPVHARGPERGAMRHD